MRVSELHKPTSVLTIGCSLHSCAVYSSLKVYSLSLARLKLVIVLSWHNGMTLKVTKVNHSYFTTCVGKRSHNQTQRKKWLISCKVDGINNDIFLKHQQ